MLRNLIGKLVLNNLIVILICQFRNTNIIPYHNIIYLTTIYHLYKWNKEIA